MTSIANPKLAVFFVALFPQFVPPGAPVLPAALMMAGVIVSFDLAWHSLLALSASPQQSAKRRAGGAAPAKPGPPRLGSRFSANRHV